MIKALTKAVLGPVWQGILIISLCYVLPLFDLLALVMQGFVTLRQGMSKGFVLILGSSLVGVSLGCFIASSINVDFYFTASLIWAITFSLPFWLVAGMLRKTVSLVYTLQIVTLLLMALFAVCYSMDINIFPDLFKKPVTDAVYNIVNNIVTAQKNSNIEEDLLLTPENISKVTNFLVHLFEVISIFSAYTISILLARMWQSAEFMPGEFKQEFTNLRTGSLITTLVACFWLLLLITPNLGISFALSGVLIIGSLWLFVNGLAYVHWLVDYYELSWGVLLFFYLLLMLPLFSSIIMLILVIAGLIDGVFDIRAYTQRLRNSD